MLLELAIGDAYGAGFEYADADLIRRLNNLSGYTRHPRHSIRAGAYTDDTQMTLAIAEAIVSGEDWTPLNLATRFVEVYKRDPREGYAGGFHAFLNEVQDGEEFLARIKGESDKSGGAMRACPLGVFGSIAEVIEKCTVQAAITHNSPDGLRAAVAAALMTHYFLYKLGSKGDLGKFLEKHVDGQWSKEWKGIVKSKGWMSVQAAVTAVVRNERMSDLLKDCINFTGDVDTVATIALGAASAAEAYEQDLPQELIWGLEGGKYGREYLIELDTKLLALVGK
jgi:ADP-ribosyl-[dinitrogen reductase] hydrolase